MTLRHKYNDISIDRYYQVSDRTATAFLSSLNGRFGGNGSHGAFKILRGRRIA